MSADSKHRAQYGGHGRIYTCPMHPQIRRAEPGSCPICGMALEPLQPAAEAGPNPELRDMMRRFLGGRRPHPPHRDSRNGRRCASAQPASLHHSRRLHLDRACARHAPTDDRVEVNLYGRDDPQRGNGSGSRMLNLSSGCPMRFAGRSYRTSASCIGSAMVTPPISRVPRAKRQTMCNL